MGCKSTMLTTVCATHTATISMWDVAATMQDVIESVWDESASMWDVMISNPHPSQRRQRRRRRIKTNKKY